MTGIEFAYLSGRQHFYRIDVITETPGLADVGQGSPCKHGISGKEHLVVKFIDADRARCMSRGMYYFEAVVAKIETGSIFQPEMYLK
jgi:hypothetical protein